MVERVRLSSDILRTFIGEGNVIVWFNKLKLVAKLREIEDVAKLIPMYLEGHALAVYLELKKKKDQADAKSIQKRLKTAFSEGAFEAYNMQSKITSGRVRSGNMATNRIGRIHGTKPREDGENGLRGRFS